MNANAIRLDGPTYHGSPSDNIYVNKAVTEWTKTGGAIDTLCKDWYLFENDNKYKTVVSPSTYTDSIFAPNSKEWIHNNDDNCGSSVDDCGYFQIGCEWVPDV